MLRWPNLRSVLAIQLSAPHFFIRSLQATHIYGRTARSWNLPHLRPFALSNLSRELWSFLWSCLGRITTLPLFYTSTSISPIVLDTYLYLKEVFINQYHPGQNLTGQSLSLHRLSIAMETYSEASPLDWRAQTRQRSCFRGEMLPKLLLTFAATSSICWPRL